MKASKASRTPANGGASDIDQLYGLEPVYEPGSDPRLVSLSDSAEVQCPWCGSSFESAVDISASLQVLVEDCRVCCQPIQLAIRIDPRTARIQIEATRAE